MYLWKALGMAPISIETLGAMAVITTIILTSDVTSAGLVFFFFFFASKRYHGLCSVLIKNKKDPTSPISQTSA